ncbi:pyridoxal phosphate-dependent transferase [Xylogone sp. PMI_703]|nr:pyridoxal phosphate-dependent transferase [Xylogone sp. PMI_703]
MGDIADLPINEQLLKYEATPFGKPMLRHFAFAEGYKNLNHGSYGTWPTAVRDKATTLRNECDATPCPFIKWEYPKLLDENRIAVAKFLEVPVETVVYVPNATTAVNTVLRNITWNPDKRDEILQFNIIYGACGKTTEYLRESTHNSVAIREIPLTLPLEDVEILQAFKDAIETSRQLDRRPRLAIFDTIVSNPGVRLPFESLTSICCEEGILSLIDGAHAIGQIDLNIKTLDPDFFVSNCHKWLFVPRGCAVFYVPERNQSMMRSTLPTSHGFRPELDHGSSGVDKSSQHWSIKKSAPKGTFVTNFEFVGTVDYTPYLCVSEAIKWREGVCGGEENIRNYCHNLAVQGGQKVAEILGTKILDNETHTLTNCSMVNILLPIYLGKKRVEGKNIVIETEGTREAVTRWMLETIVPDYKTFIPIFWFQGAWWCRLSAQVYLDIEDFEWAGRVLKDLCERVGRGEFLARD